MNNFSGYIPDVFNGLTQLVKMYTSFALFVRYNYVDLHFPSRSRDLSKNQYLTGLFPSTLSTTVTTLYVSLMSTISLFVISIFKYLSIFPFYSDLSYTSLGGCWPYSNTSSQGSSYWSKSCFFLVDDCKTIYLSCFIAISIRCRFAAAPRCGRTATLPLANPALVLALSFPLPKPVLCRPFVRCLLFLYFVCHFVIIRLIRIGVSMGANKPASWAGCDKALFACTYGWEGVTCSQNSVISL